MPDPALMLFVTKANLMGKLSLALKKKFEVRG